MLALATILSCTGPDERPDPVPTYAPEPVPEPEGGAIAYTLTFPAPQTHYVEVAASYPTRGADSVELMMATWTPGSYLIREFARHVEDLRSDAGPVTKIAKNRWTVPTNGAERVGVRYRVYGREMTVRTNWIDADKAILNGAPTFITLVDGQDLPHEVTVDVPEDQADAFTALTPHPDGVAQHYRAADFDELVDSPILTGNPSVYDFDVAGVPHQLINLGERSPWNGPQSAEDTQKIVEAQTRFWGTVPYPRYLFLNVIADAGGGLEHKASTLMMTNRLRTSKRSDYIGWLGLVSHEFFHTWNVKRLRPVELGPFDYENEVHTKSLWIAEGFTSYYDDLLLARAGIIDRDEYLGLLTKQIGRLQSVPGRLVHPLGMTSYDAWIKFYRSDENSRNTTVSYYTKGAIVGFLLDVQIRQATNDAKTLDDVMRRAYDDYSGERGYTPAEFRAVVNEVAGTDLGPFLARAVDSTEELEYDDALRWFGLRWKPAPKKKADDEGPKAWLGANTADRGGRVVVTALERETPGYLAGLNVDDEIIALDGLRVKPGQLTPLVESFEPGAEVPFTIARRGELRVVPVVLGETMHDPWLLEADPDASAVQRRRLDQWLGQE